MTRVSFHQAGFRVALAAAFVTALLPSRAEAHLPSVGLGPIYDGLFHFLLSPEDIIPVFALALFVGLRGAEYGRRALFVLPAAWLAGGLLGLLAGANRGGAFAFLSFLLLGGLVAANAQLSLRTTTVLAALIGLFHGYWNGAGMDRFGDGALALLGLTFAVFVIVAVASSLVVPLQQQWTLIVVRVLGSWIAASGLLMLGWRLRGKP
jgi:hydrogenase/urease accessory protein HupE